MTEQPSGTLVHDEPETPAAPPSARRRFPLVALIFLSIVPLAAIAVLIWAGHYQPLSQNFGGGYGSQILTMNNQLAPHTYGTYGPQSESETIWNEPAGSYKAAVQFTLNNDGSFPITIDQVLTPWAQGYNTHFDTFFDSTKRDQGGYGYRGGPIFHATTLPGHGDLTLVMHWTARCIPGASTTTTLTTTQVTYSFMGMHHTVSVPLQPFELKYRPTC